MIFLFQGWILRFHVNLPGCIQQTKLPGSQNLCHHEAPPGPSDTESPNTTTGGATVVSTGTKEPWWNATAPGFLYQQIVPV